MIHQPTEWRCSSGANWTRMPLAAMDACDVDGSSLKILLSYHYRTNIRLLISDCEPTCLLFGPRFDEGNASGNGESGRLIIIIAILLRNSPGFNQKKTLNVDQSSN